MIWFRLAACLKCEGDLALDNCDWLCLQCGTYYYTGLYQPSPASVPPPASGRPDAGGGTTQKSIAGRDYTNANSPASNQTEQP